MSIVNLTTIAPVSSKGFSGRSGIGRTKSSHIQASITFFNSKTPAFKVTADRGPYRGRKGNFLKFGVYRQAGVRYILTCFEFDGDKNDGTVSTAGVAEGATTAAGIVSKINSSNLGNFVTATLLNNATNIDYTGATGVAAGDAIPMTGGRSRGR
tara:strand:+ start:389 stop:850 length:462 start_codon:yes stop_codon:yes gene_type:complete